MKVFLGTLLLLSLCHCKTRPASKGSLQEVENDKEVQQLLALTEEIAKQPDGEEKEKNRASFLGRLTKAEEEKRLDKLTETIVNTIKKRESKKIFWENLPPEKVAKIIEQLKTSTRMELFSRGFLSQKPPIPYKNWSKVEASFKESLQKVWGTSGKPAAIGSDAFWTQLEAIGGRPMSQANRVELLINGPDAFKKRDELLDQAKWRVWILSWAFYDDETGQSMADKLIELHNKGLDVRVVVDGQLADKPIHAGPIVKMEKEKISVVRWRSKVFPYHGQHRKLFIIDDHSFITGGMNYGNVYSHKGTGDANSKWRDTDVFVQGPATREALYIFISVWNEFVAEFNKVDLGPATIPYTNSVTAETNAQKVLLVNHTPTNTEEGKKYADAIYLSYLHLFTAAEKKIEISNAYYIASPPLKRALISARERGVEVTVHANSPDTLSEPALGRPIMKSLAELAAAGAKVAFKQGSTLHSKYAVIDRKIAVIGSYNLHPRSYRYDGENALIFAQAETAQKLGEQFDKDIAEAKIITEPKNVPINDSLVFDLLENIYFDQL